MNMGPGGCFQSGQRREAGRPMAFGAGDWSAYLFLAALLGLCTRTRRILDLDEQFAFYASYHTHRLNQAIHFVCIPALLWSALVLLDATQPLGTVAGAIPINASAIAAAIYAGYYVALDRRSVYGVASAVLVAALHASARSFRAAAGVRGAPLPVALGVHLAGWTAQLLGHKVFEGRQPALAENLAQALLMAPHFALVEGWFALGLRADLRARVEPAVRRRLAEFAAKGC